MDHEWEFVGYDTSSGVFDKRDVDKDGNPVTPLDTKSIIVGQQWYCMVPLKKYKCKICKEEIAMSPLFPNPGYCDPPKHGCHKE